MKQCGSTTSDGEICERPAGWGTDNDLGPCRDHLDEVPEGWAGLLSQKVPEELTPLWNEAMRWLKQKGIFTWGNAMMVVVAMNRWKRYLESDEDIEAEGLTREDKKNERLAKHPAWTANKQAVNQLRLILNNLGVTTTSMNQIDFENQDTTESKLSEMLDG